MHQSPLELILYHSLSQYHQIQVLFHLPTQQNNKQKTRFFLLFFFFFFWQIKQTTEKKGRKENIKERERELCIIQKSQTQIPTTRHKNQKEIPNPLLSMLL